MKDTYLTLRGSDEKQYFVNTVIWTLEDTSDLTSDQLDKVREAIETEIEYRS